MNWKELDNKLSEKINLNKKYPGYFTKAVFYIGIYLLIAISIFDIYLNHGNLYDIQYTCNNYGGFCANPFFNETNPQICNLVDCDSIFLEGGYSVGRKDFIAQNRLSVVFYILFGMFILNHIVYSIKNKKLLYTRE